MPGLRIASVQFSWVELLSCSVAQSSPVLWDPMDCSMSGLPIRYQLTEFIQTHVHWVSVAIQPSHPLSSPSSPTFSLSYHQGLFKWVIKWLMRLYFVKTTLGNIWRMNYKGTEMKAGNQLGGKLQQSGQDIWPKPWRRRDGWIRITFWMQSLKDLN